MLQKLLRIKYIFTGFILLFLFHLFSIQANGNDTMIEIRLIKLLALENTYRLFVSNGPCFDAKLSTIKAEDLKQKGWIRTKMPIDKGATYDLLEIKPIKNWVLDKNIKYDGYLLINPCTKEKIGYLKFSTEISAYEWQEVILPIIVENCYAYAIEYCKEGLTARLVTRGDTKLPLWCFGGNGLGVSSSGFYVLTIEGTPKSMLSASKEMLGDLNPRPILYLLP